MWGTEDGVFLLLAIIMTLLMVEVVLVNFFSRPVGLRYTLLTALAIPVVAGVVALRIQRIRRHEHREREDAEVVTRLGG